LASFRELEELSKKGGVGFFCCVLGCLLGLGFDLENKKTKGKPNSHNITNVLNQPK